MRRVYHEFRPNVGKYSSPIRRIWVFLVGDFWVILPWVSSPFGEYKIQVIRPLKNDRWKTSRSFEDAKFQAHMLWKKTEAI